MNPGELDQRVTIEQKSVTRDAFGAEVITWATLAIVWAKCTDVRDTKRGGDERIEQSQRILGARTTVLMRWRGDVTTAMRIKWTARSRTLQIVSKAETGRREGLELSCEEYSV